ncbi:MAG: PilN domain-containing protein [Gammaproteobacteria bacterium]|nr:PilN domain-containing protein [Gammaproteobacteria bacterium]MDH5654164.1 PilN domain-containing protein [Gammaproteobacteria bacterium]
MKMRINLSTMPNPPVTVLATVFTIMLVCTLILISWLVYSGMILADKRTELSVVRDKLDKRVADMKTKPALEQTDSRTLAEFNRQLLLINNLEKSVGKSASFVMARIENLLPDSVYLINFRYQRDSGEVSLTAESKQTSSLALFLHKLEKDELFSDVLLARQQQTGDGGNRRIQYSIKFIGRSG